MRDAPHGINMDNGTSYILTFTCADRVGIVSAVTGRLAAIDGFIIDSQQYADLETGRFFMRVQFQGAGLAFPRDLNELRLVLADIVRQFEFDWSLHADSDRPRVMIAVSKGSHCLNDLLHRWRTGTLPVDIAGIVSNHENMRSLTEWHELDFHYLPIGEAGKEAQEEKLWALFESTGSELMVLARYMQVLSPELSAKLEGRCINIHHSFLPGFKGAKPYHRAHERGVKLIGATAHFVTDDLDEGPIIEQAVERVDHRASVQDMIRIGRDIEAHVLARAVGWVAERRVFMNGNRTVIFR